MKYLELELYNREPLRIGNDDTSQRGQTNTLLYIPGSTVRGVVIHGLCREGQEFERIKKLLFSDKIHFMNVYLKRDKKAMIPSLKGFYEDKKGGEGKKKIENIVVNKMVSPGTKRASLGHYCYPEGDCIVCTKVALGENMNINRGREGEKTVFRSQYMGQGQHFCGYITFDDCVAEDIIQKIKNVFSKEVSMGNSRYGGYGACQCVRAEIKEGLPYGELRTKADRSRFYLVLLSNMTMRDSFGQPAGLDLDILAEKLGCGPLRLVSCATSVTEVMGYNRSWKGPVPSAVMYEAGSVFCMETESGERIPAERFAALEEEGLGIRKNEGFGQILFFDGYEKLQYKQWTEKADWEERKNVTASVVCAMEPEDMRIAAKGLLTRRLERAVERYLVEKPLDLDGVSDSKLGVVQSLCLELRYVPGEAKKCLTEYITHWEEKDSRQKVHGEKKRQDALHKYVRRMLEAELADILEIPEKERSALRFSMTDVFSEEDLLRYKLQLMIRQIRYANREVREREN